MKISSFFVCIFVTLSSVLVGQQVPLRSIVEHFTNTKCSVCASRNPGFYTNLNNHPTVQHLSVHPSSPYSSCPLSQQNTVDNDARTNYYGVYGSTPRLVINGDVISGSVNYSSASMFTPYIGLTSSFLLKVSQAKVGTDSIKTTVVIHKKDTSLLTSASLFIGLVEDTVFVNGGNGEAAHYNVLRESSTSSSGQVISLPSMVNDSVVINSTTAIKVFWNQNRIFSISILQNATSKKVIQTNKSTLLSSSAGLNEMTMGSTILIYPNPATNQVYIQSKDQEVNTFELYSYNGSLVKKGMVENSAVNVSDLNPGIYSIKVHNRKNTFRSIISIQGH